MNNYAYVLVEGNLTADPELKKLNGGKQVCQFSIAVNHYSKSDEGDGSEVSYVDVETWDKQAENCYEFLKKGRSVTIMGNLKQERWKASDGSPKSKFKIMAMSVRFNYTEKASKKDYREDRKAA
jgi:single-strand DNA-binding protein